MATVLTASAVLLLVAALVPLLSSLAAGPSRSLSSGSRTGTGRHLVVAVGLAAAGLGLALAAVTAAPSPARHLVLLALLELVSAVAGAWPERHVWLPRLVAAALRTVPGTAARRVRTVVDTRAALAAAAADLRRHAAAGSAPAGTALRALAADVEAAARSGDPSLALLVVRARAAVTGLDALADGDPGRDGEHLRAAVVVLLGATRDLARELTAGPARRTRAGVVGAAELVLADR